MLQAWLSREWKTYQIDSYMCDLFYSGCYDMTFNSGSIHRVLSIPRAFYQIRKIEGCTCAVKARNAFPATAGHTCRDTCRDRFPVVSFEMGGGENHPAFPAKAQSAILRIWQEAHSPKEYGYVRHYSCLLNLIFRYVMTCHDMWYS